MSREAWDMQRQVFGVELPIFAQQARRQSLPLSSWQMADSIWNNGHCFCVQAPLAFQAVILDATCEPSAKRIASRRRQFLQLTLRFCTSVFNSHFNTGTLTG